MIDDNYSDDWVVGPIDAISSAITSAELVDKGLRLTLANGATVDIEDDGQQCCENRYAKCDDDLSVLVGARLMRVTVKGMKEEPCPDGFGERHEVAFLDVVTSNGSVTLCTHNEHNGYYGGFNLRLNITVPGNMVN